MPAKNMVPPEYEPLAYFRRFPNNYDYASIAPLFDNRNCNSGYFPIPKPDHITWKVRQEFASINYGEPLECVHARRFAFGSEDIYVDETRTTPDRCLIFPTSKGVMSTYGHVQLRWCVPGVMEIPKFCIGSAQTDQSRVQWGLGPHSIETLRAATKLVPHAFDVFGFVVPDKHVIGAVEIVRKISDDLFDAHVFAVSSDLDLAVGDELWGCYSGNIGDTRISASRLVAVVKHVSGDPVPPLERPDGG